ncbi:MAG: NHL repeat-containing protein [Planctomycetes bacterium]|nr:NHL repeat-containing protein [Planctomycetota bacterium]
MKYRLTATIPGRSDEAHRFTTALRGLALGTADALYMAGDQCVQVFDEEGRFVRRIDTSAPGHAVAIATDGTVWVGEEERIEIFSAEGKRLRTWTDAARFGRVTAISFHDEDVILADAAARCLRRYTREGEFVNDIGHDNRMKGFLIPNGVLDFALDDAGVIHASNPGKHRIERYTLDGRLLGHIGRFDGRDPEGFRGCCNPTNVTVTSKGHAVVTEKADPRVKILDAEGKLVAIVATEPFDPVCKNMDVVVDSKARVYVADTVKLHACVFTPETQRI